MLDAVAWQQYIPEGVECVLASTDLREHSAHVS